MKKKLFKNGIKNSGLASFGKGLIKTVTGVNTVQSVASVVKEKVKSNKLSEVSGEGNTDWYEFIGIGTGVIAGAVVLSYSLYLLFTGQIGLSEFMELNQ